MYTYSILVYLNYLLSSEILTSTSDGKFKIGLTLKFKGVGFLLAARRNFFKEFLKLANVLPKNY